MKTKTKKTEKTEKPKEKDEVRSLQIKLGRLNKAYERLNKAYERLAQENHLLTEENRRLRGEPEAPPPPEADPKDEDPITSYITPQEVEWIKAEEADQASAPSAAVADQLASAGE